MNLYDTNVLVGVVQSLIRPQSFLLDTFFPQVINSDTKAISFDVILGKRRVSPFVSPLVQGKVVKSRQVKVNTFEPAYVKDKRVIDPTRPIARQVGEQIGGGVISAQQREQAAIAFEMEDQTDMLTRRQELMAADALLDGIEIIVGEDFPSVSIDFGRDAALTVTLTSTARWGETGVSPADSLEAWGTLIVQKSGAAPTDIVFTPEAWALFIADDKVKNAVFFPRSGESNFEFGAQPIEGAMFKGVWGSYRLWVYNSWYVDDNDVEQRVLPAYTVIMGSKMIDGARCFGAILDPKAGYKAMEFFPSSWITDDPAQRWLMLQSAPLMVPTRPNASFCATVR